jgi:large repetitive protein
MSDEVKGKKETILMEQKGDRTAGQQSRNSVKGRVASILYLCPVALLLFMVIVLPAYASQGGEILNQIRDWDGADPTSGLQNPYAMVMDSDGNVILTGSSDASGSDDFYTVKFKADGSGILWRATYSAGSMPDIAAAVAVDSNKDVIVTGKTWNVSNANYDIYTVKYNSSDGSPASGWPRIFNGPADGDDSAKSIAVDSSGNIYIGGKTPNTTNGSDDFVIIKYAPNGDLDTGFGTNGVVTYDGAEDCTSNCYDGADWTASIAVGSTGVAVTGYSESKRSDILKDYDCLTIKYSTSGAKLWEYRHDMPGDNRGKIVRMDSAGNVIMAGFIYNGTDKDIHVTKFDKDEDPAYPGLKKGKVLWEQDHDGGYSEDEPYALIVDASDNIYMTGNSFSINTSDDFYTAKYNSSGEIRWSALLNTSGGNGEVPTGITLNSIGEVFVTGYTKNAIEHNYDWLTAKYSANGDLLWSKTFNGPGNHNDRSVGIGLLSSTEKIYVAGWTDMWTSGSSDYDYYMIIYDSGTLNRPTRLSATTINTGLIDLAWTDNSTSINEDGFRIERCEGAGCDFSAKTTFAAGQNVTGYSDGTVAADKTYRYRVYAYKNVPAENSAYSDVAETQTTALNPVSPTWSYIYNGGSSDEAASIGAGPDQNPVVTGYSHINGGTYDYYTIKLDRTNAGVKWKGAWDDVNFGEDTAVAAAVDNNNDVIVSGYGPSPNGDDDIYTIKYHGSGSEGDVSPLWGGAERFGNSSYDYVVNVSADDSKCPPGYALPCPNVFVVGYGKRNKSDRDDEDIYLIKYPYCNDPAESCQSEWTATYDGGYGDDRPAGVVADSAGNVYITGYTKNSANHDYFTAKYCGAKAPAVCSTPLGNKNPGEIIWSKTYNGAGDGNDYAKSIDMGPSGNVYVTGLVTNTYGKKDFYTVKYNSRNGDVLWAKSYGGSAVSDYEAASIKVDPIDDLTDDGIVVAGTILTEAGNHDFYIIRYNEDGGIAWQKTILNPGVDDIVKTMAMDPTGNVCIAGDSGTAPDTDILAVKISYAGDIIGATRFDGAAHGSDITAASAANDYGEIFIAGSAMNSSDYDYAVFMCKGDTVVVPSPFTLTEIAGSASDNQQISLAWSNTMLPDATFTLDRIDSTCISGSCSWINLLTDSNDVTFLDGGSGGALLADNKYCYRLKAAKSGVDSRWLNKCRITTMSPPSLSSLTVMSTTAIDVSWVRVPDTSVSVNLGYKLERCHTSCSSEAGWSWIGGVLDPDTTLYHDNDADNDAHGTARLTAGTTYYYRLSVRNAAGYSLPGGQLSATTIPPPPLLNNPSSITTDSMYLEWGPASGANSYTLQFKPGAGTYVDVPGCVAVAGTSCSIGSLSSGSQYFFRVKAANAAGESVWSNEVDGYTLPSQPTLTSVTRSDCSSGGNSSSTASITWNDVSDETGYYVEYAYCSDAPNCASGWTGWNDGGRPGNNETSTTITMSAGYAYRFRVFSTVNSSTYSAASNEGAVWSCMNGFSQGDITPISDISLQVNWTNIEGNTAYDIQRQACTGPCNGSTCTGGGYSSVQTGGKDDTAWQDPGPLSGSYSYKIRAYNTNDLSGTFPGLTPPPDVWSNERCLQTPPPSPDTVTAAASSSALSIEVKWCQETQSAGCTASPSPYTGYVLERSFNNNDDPGTDSNPAYWVGFSTIATIGGNLLSNSSFENSSSGWTSLNNPSQCSVAPSSVPVLTNNGGGSWSKAVKLNIDNFKPDYQTMLVVSYDSSMQADFNDIRFYDETAGTELFYWIESKTDSSSATVWIKIGENNDIRMYYGNNLAASSSNGNNVFELYDPSNAGLVSVFTKYNSDSSPVLAPGPEAWDQTHLLCPSVIKESNGTYKMWYSGYNGVVWDGIGYATSTDGITWTKYASNPVLGLGPGSWDNTHVYCSSVMKDSDGTYKMWYNGQDSTNARIGYAASPDGITWTKYDSDSNPVLDLGPGSWDITHVYTPWVIKDDSDPDPTKRYKMWYSGYNGAVWDGIGYATSPDGINWTKYNSDSNPVLGLGPGGSWDVYAIYGITVIKDTDNVYKMWYSGHDGYNLRIGYASSTDGTNWTKFTSNPVINPGPGSWDNTHVSYLGVLKDSDGSYKMWYSGYSSAWEIGLASVRPRKYAAAEPAASFCNGTINTSNPKAGTKSLDLSSDGTISSLLRKQSGISVTPGKQYILSGWFNTSLTQGRARCELYNGVTVYAGIEQAGNSSGWVNLRTAITPSTASLDIRCFADGSPNGTAYIDSIIVSVDPSSGSSTTYIDTDVTNGYGYKYRLRGIYDDAGSTAYTGYTSPDPYTRTIPSTPSFYTIYPDSPTQITAYWYDVAGNTGFNLQWKEMIGYDCDNGSWTTYNLASVGCPHIPAFGQNLCSFTCNGTCDGVNVSDGKTYCYRVMSYNDIGNSDYSAVSTRMTLLSPPSTITLTVMSADQIDINWNDVAGNTGYRIVRSLTGDDPWTEIATTGDSVTYYSNTGLTAGTKYYYRIFTKNGENNYSVPSDVVSKTTKPASPVSLSLNVISESRIDISWQVTYGATGYKVEGTIGVGGGWEMVGSELSGPAVAYQELYCGYYSAPTVNCTTLIPKYISASSTGLEENRKYCYVVSAYNEDGGYSAPSSPEVCATTRSMNAPVLISVTAPTSRQLDLLWSYTPCPSCDAPDGYEIESRAGSDKWMSRAVISGPSASKYSDRTGIQPSTEYTYRVRTYKLIFNDGFNAINPLIWTQSSSVPDGHGSSSVTSTGSAVRLETIAADSGTAGTYNSSAISLLDPEMLSGDFDVQTDFALPNGQTTAGRYNVYARVLISFPVSAGNDNYIMAERSINYYGGAWKNLYQGTVVVNGIGNSGYYETSDTSGKLRITKNGSTVSAYARINDIWYLLNSNNGTTVQSAPTGIWLIQYAQQGEGVNMTADIDNFKVITKSAYSNEKSATTPAWQNIDDACQ